MQTKVLFLKGGPECEKTHTFQHMDSTVECARLSCCDSVYCFGSSASAVSQSIRSDRLVIPWTTSDTSHGLICKYPDSRLFFASLFRDAAIQCVTLEVEGLLDDGLRPKRDFELVEVIPLEELVGMDRAFLASRTLDGGEYWAYVFDVTPEGAMTLLESATMGYQIGFRVLSDPDRRVTARLVRAAGYDDGETDLLLVTEPMARLPGLPVLAYL